MLSRAVISIPRVYAYMRGNRRITLAALDAVVGINVLRPDDANRTAPEIELRGAVDTGAWMDEQRETVEEPQDRPEGAGHAAEGAADDHSGCNRHGEQ